MRPQTEERTDCILIAVAATVFYVVGMWRGSHYNSDDALYAQMAREMLETGDFIDNRWLGVVQFEKPPLLLWSLALAGAGGGFGEGALRAPVTLFGVTGLLAFYLLARTLGLVRRAALSATALLAVSTFYLLMTRRLMTDIPLLACSLLTAATLLRGRVLGAGVFAGLAVLAKGAAAAPLLAAVYGYAWLARVRSARDCGKSLGMALLVAAPWHVLVSVRHGAEFWHGYLGHHVQARMTRAVVPGLTAMERVELLVSEPVLVGLTLVGIARDRFALSRLHAFAWSWLVLSALPLIVSTTVLPHYLLPLTPALALLAVQAASPRWWEHRLAPMLAAAAVACSLLADPAKIVWWLDPDFGPDQKAIGQQLAHVASKRDSLFAYNLTTAALVFYSGGLPIGMAVDDQRFLEIQAAVLMNQRQTGHPGEVRDLRTLGLAAVGAGHRFVVVRQGAARSAIEQLLRQQSPARPLFHRDSGALSLVNDAADGDRLEPRR